MVYVHTEKYLNNVEKKTEKKLVSKSLILRVSDTILAGLSKITIIAYYI